MITFLDLVPVLECRVSVGDMLYNALDGRKGKCTYEHLRDIARYPSNWTDVWVVTKVKVESKHDTRIKTYES